jgi:hypothetical protein
MATATTNPATLWPMNGNRRNNNRFMNSASDEDRLNLIVTTMAQGAHLGNRAIMQIGLLRNLNVCFQ